MREINSTIRELIIGIAALMDVIINNQPYFKHTTNNYFEGENDEGLMLWIGVLWKRKILWRNTQCRIHFSERLELSDFPLLINKSIFTGWQSVCVFHFRYRAEGVP